MKNLPEVTDFIKDLEFMTVYITYQDSLQSNILSVILRKTSMIPKMTHAFSIFILIPRFRNNTTQTLAFTYISRNTSVSAMSIYDLVAV